MRNKRAGGSRVSVATLWVLCLLVIPAMEGTAYAASNVGLDTPRPKILEKKNVEVIGWNDMQGRGTLQVTAKGDWLYAGHHNGHAVNPLTGVDEWNGTTIFDISNPAKPKITAHIPNEENTNSRAVQVVYNWQSPAPAGHAKADYLVRNKETGNPGRALKFSISPIDITRNSSQALNVGFRGLPIQFFHKGWRSEKTGYILWRLPGKSEKGRI